MKSIETKEANSLQITSYLKLLSGSHRVKFVSPGVLTQQGRKEKNVLMTELSFLRL